MAPSRLFERHKIELFGVEISEKIIKKLEKGYKTMNKKEIYKSFGIEYQGGKIKAPEFGWISPLLIDGNSKLGKGVWTFSTLPGTAEYIAEFFGREYTAKGTCPCDCNGCYAQTGFYRMPSVFLPDTAPATS